MTALEQIEAMRAAGQLHLCGRGPAKPITEAEAQILLDFAEFLSNRPTPTPRRTDDRTHPRARVPVLQVRSTRTGPGVP